MNQWSVGLTLLLASTSVLAKDIQLLNVSYDPTRELYAALDPRVQLQESE